MKHCEPCNLDFPDGYRFCGSCGGLLSDSRRCANCGELVEGKWTFCTSCGRSLSGERTVDQTSQPKSREQTDLPASLASSLPARTPPPQTLTMPSSEQPTTTPERQRSEKSTPEEWYSAADLYDDNTTATPASPLRPQERVLETKALIPHVTAATPAKDERSAPALTMLSAYSASEAPSQFRWWHGAILALFVLLIIGGIAVGGWYWWSHRGLIAQTTLAADSNNGPVPQSSATFPSPKSTSTSSAQTITSNSADQEIKLLRERRTGAKPSESAEIIAAFQGAEKSYPVDYRFPYERAKLSIAGVASHHEAFGALALAAEKAIDNGKTREMLDSLMADKDGDFRKLSRGHREWRVLEEALRNKDRASLKALHH